MKEKELYMLKQMYVHLPLLMLVSIVRKTFKKIIF